MSKLFLEWHIVQESVEELRYCHNCGRKTTFKDSMIRRHNANGKNIFKFAIYKCPKGHTWNKKLEIFKANSEEVEVIVEREVIIEPEVIILQEIKEKQITEIVISIHQVEGKWRLDKLLSQQLKGVSRREIVEWIEQGKILVDKLVVKPNMRLREGQEIHFFTE